LQELYHLEGNLSTLFKDFDRSQTFLSGIIPIKVMDSYRLNNIDLENPTLNSMISIHGKFTNVTVRLNRELDCLELEETLN
jgi:hypothetical protein